MFSALRFMIAGVIVALFGGFLLTSILTTQQGDEMVPAAVTAPPSPVTTEELLSDMATEEVEPGVYKVVNDGVRDLTSVEAGFIEAGYDGGIWLLQQDELAEFGLLRLGSDGFHGWPTAGAPDDSIFEVAPDGTMWVIPPGTSVASSDMRRGRGPALRSSDGETWTVQSCPQGLPCLGFTVAPDGMVWASWRTGTSLWRVGYLGPSGWQPLDGFAQGTGIGYRGLFITDAGDLYGHKRSGTGLYYRYEDGDWERVSEPVYEYNVDVGPDGTVWHHGEDGLTRFADGEWAQWTTADLLPDIRFGLGLDYQFRVAPDGSLWSSLWQSADGTEPGGTEPGGELGPGGA